MIKISMRFALYGLALGSFLLLLINLPHIEREYYYNAWQLNPPPCRETSETMGEQNKGLAPKSTSKKSVSFFSDIDNLDKVISLGPHFLTTVSGCRMARWVYPTTNRLADYDDCMHTPNSKLLQPKSTGIFDHVQPLDTIYVINDKLPKFVKEELEFLTTDVVILTGQRHKRPTLDVSVVQTLLNHPNVIHWFCHNLDTHLDLKTLDSATASKISPFPYGLFQKKWWDSWSIRGYKEVFLESLEESRARPGIEKKSFTNCSIYIGPLRPWPWRVAKQIPGATLERSENVTRIRRDHFFRELAQCDYVLSPNGDRPECYRHYEAIGLGVVPITELDTTYYGHLQDGPIVYDTTKWSDLTLLEEEAKKKIQHRKTPLGTLRNMILEEYWMEYVEEKVGRPLHWWNVERNHTTTLKELRQVAARHS